MPELRRVIVDTKESASSKGIGHALWFEDQSPVPGSFLAEGYKAERTALPDCDLKVQLPAGAPSAWLRVELKTWADLIAALRDRAESRIDTRLRHQLGRLLTARQMGGQVSLMVVGAIKPAGGRGNRKQGVYFTVGGKSRYNPSVSWNEAWSVVEAVQHLGIMFSAAESEFHVPSAVRVLSDVVSRDAHFPPNGLPKLSTLYPALDPLATTLTAVPTIGPGTATGIAVKFRDFPTFYAASIEELTEVPGVGKTLAQRIHAHFHGLGEQGELKTKFD